LDGGRRKNLGGVEIANGDREPARATAHSLDETDQPGNDF
jgi:hypothetical protein